MENPGNEYLCGRADEIVSYIYGEIDGTPRTEFENHLRDCVICTDEFAMISDARFSVFEWHKEVFAELPTPQFSIPRVVEPRRSTGVVSSLVAALSGSGWAAPAVAVVLLSIALGSYYLTSSDAPADLGRVEFNKAEIATVDDSSDISRRDPVSSDVDGRIGSTEPLLRNDPVSSKPRTIAARASRTESSKIKSTKTAKDASPRAVQPVLSRYADIEDKSLRLSDLLDEAGG